MTPRPLDPATSTAKLSALEGLLDALESMGEVSGDRLRREMITRLAVERALTQAVDLVVSVCSHVVGAEARRAPTTYRDAITAAGRS